MKKLLVVLLILALAGCASFRALTPVEKAVVTGFVVFTAGVAGFMVYTAATTTPITQEQYDAIFKGGK
jgi:cell division protein FtsL